MSKQKQKDPFDTVSRASRVRLRQSLHVGHKCAFGNWKLIWMDAANNCAMANIPEKTAKALIAAGMDHEG